MRPEVADHLGYPPAQTRRLVAGVVLWSFWPTAVALLLGCGSVGPPVADPADDGESSPPTRDASPPATEPPSAEPLASQPRSEPATIRWEADAPAAFARARREGRALLVFVRAGWSVGSSQMDRDVWADRRVRRAVRAVIPLAVDVTEVTGEDDEQVARLGVEGVPAVVLLDATAQPIGRIVGGCDAEAVLALLAKVLER